jgi:hypothetical protein
MECLSFSVSEFSAVRENNGIHRRNIRSGQKEILLYRFDDGESIPDFRI